MKSRALTIFLVLLFALKVSVIAEIEDGTSKIQIKGTDKVQTVKLFNPKSNPPAYHNYSVGTFKGKFQDGSYANFYCIDLGHGLLKGALGNEDYPYTDAGETSEQITYILNNYYPHKTDYFDAGNSTEVKKEAAAVQCAIWHYSDSLDISKVQTADIRTRAQEIINDVEANYQSMQSIKTLVISNEDETVPQGNDESVYVEVYNLNNDMMNVDNSNFNDFDFDIKVNGQPYDTQYLEFENGKLKLNLPYNVYGNEATVEVTARVTIPHGTKYVVAGHENTYQKIVLATPHEDLLQETIHIAWQATVDVEVTKDADVDEVANNGSFNYQIKVKNNSNIAATNVVVKDILPDNITVNSINAESGITVDEDNMEFTIAELAGGETKTITINAKAAIANPNSAPSVDLGVASDYNLFVFDRVEFPSSDVEGKAAIGNYAKFSNYSIGDKLAPNSGNVLVVGKTVVFTSGRVYNGNVLYGKKEVISKTASVDGDIIKADANNPMIDFAQAKKDLKKLSSNISHRTSNGTVTHEYGELKLTGNDPYLNVFYVTKDQIDYANTNNMVIDVPNGSSALININAKKLNWSGGLEVRGTGIANVLYNFYNARKITIQGIDVRGTILAPNATLDFVSGVVNGQVICNRAYGSGQYNNVKFLGSLPQDQMLTNTAQILNIDQIDNNEDNNSDQAVVKVTFSSNGGNGGNGGSGSGSSDNNWEETDDNSITEVIWCMDKDEDGKQIVGTVGGKLYRKENDGFKHLNESMNVNYIWAVSVDKSNGKIWCGTDNGVYISRDKGKSWELRGLEGKDVRAIKVLSDDHVFAGTWGYGIFELSSATGYKFEERNDDLEALAVHSLVVKNGKMYAATFGNGGVFKFEDSKWKKLNIGYDYVWSLGVTKSGKLVAGTYGGGVYTSDDDVNWTKHDSGLPSNYVYCVNTNDDDVFVSTWAGGVYKLNLSSSSMAKQNGSWEDLGLENEDVSSIYTDDNNEVLVGTKSGNIYKLVKSPTDVNEFESLPKEYKLEQNYPNPFNPSTTIKFAVTKAGNYQLTIYNALGQEVARLLNGNLNAGNHSVRFDASNLSSGIYFYRLTGSNVALTKKMILMK